jgi:hypothetical protein
MSYRDTVLYTAFQELSYPVHWKHHEARILEYFKVSTGIPYTKASALQVSWCSYFVHWCLVKGGMQVLPQAGTAGTLGSMGSIGRFMKPSGGKYESFPVFKKDYVPQPGDMYNRPKPNNHIGFISDVRPLPNGKFEVRTIDGNSGPMSFSPYFDGTINPATGRTWIGAGFIYQPPGWRSLSDDCWYIKLCDD